MPAIIRKLAPTGSLTIHEKSSNAYPYTRTVYTNDYMKDGFHTVIETRHEPGTGDIENVHNLNGAQLQKRIVDKLTLSMIRSTPEIINQKKTQPNSHLPKQGVADFQLVTGKALKIQ